MTKELSEDSKFKISIKTLAWIIAGVATVIAGSTILAMLGYRELTSSIVNGISIDSLTINE